MMYTNRRGCAGSGRARGAEALAVGAAICLALAGCSLDELLGNDDLPPDVMAPDAIETPEGARAAYHAALVQFRRAFAQEPGGYVAVSGLLTDELEWGSYVEAGLGTPGMADMRRASEGGTGEAGSIGSYTYSALQRARNQAEQAAGLLVRHFPGGEPLAAHAYAVRAYTEILLADLFCSGIPLSSLDPKEGFTYRPGSTTEEVYEHALALLDTATTLVGDSARIEHLIRVGQGRALLALGRFDAAAHVVAGVPDDYRYEVAYGAQNGAQSFAALEGHGSETWPYSVADREGINGIDFITSGDPRTRVTTQGTNVRGRTVHHPMKYGGDGSARIPLASGIEARLIEAEAALRAGDVSGWLAKLNHLRRTAWPAIEPAVSGPLPDLDDPGTDAARVDLLFRERAFWLFLTGQRQGDLRRLLRHYGRTQDQLYPVGPYHHSRTPGLSYGAAVDLPVPAEERVSNPHYNGCIARGA